MPLDPEQKIRMALGGTTGLPSPYPSIGKISLESRGKASNGDPLVAITQKHSPSQANVWIVRASDVAAIEKKKKVNPVNKKGEPKEPEWFVGRRRVLKCLRRGPVKGIAYVREEAQVLLRLEYGLSAEESADAAQLASMVAPKDRTTDEQFGAACHPKC